MKLSIHLKVTERPNHQHTAKRVALSYRRAPLRPAAALLSPTTFAFSFRCPPCCHPPLAGASIAV